MTNSFQEMVKLIDGTLIPHPGYQAVEQQLDVLYRTMEVSVDPMCLAITGDSRAGKSRALEMFELAHKPYRSPEGLKVPVLRVRVPSKPTAKLLAQTFLYKLRDPLYAKGSEGVLTCRLMKLIPEVGTRVIVLDEFQHFVDKATAGVQEYVTDWLKVFVDELNLGLVVAGLPNCMAVIYQNKQLRGRFFAPAEIKRFNWNDEDSRLDFIDVLAALQRALEPLSMPDLCSDDMAFRMYLACGGLMGFLMKIMRAAVTETALDGSMRISLDVLATAYVKAVVQDPIVVNRIGNPFKMDFKLVDQDRLIFLALQIGKEDDLAPTQPRRRSRRLTSNQVLRT